MEHPQVIIIGAGLAGLNCARILHQQGIPLLLLEQSGRVGGKVATDRRAGFLLDRGFQVLLTAYEEARRTLDFEALQLCHFSPGALVWNGKRFLRIADPWRDPFTALRTLFSSPGTLGDKYRMARFRSSVVPASVEELFSRPETTARELLSSYKFSADFIEQFLRPFFAGVFFDRALTTSSRMLEFCLKMFATGHASLPAEGMEEIPRQLASAALADAVQLNAKVLQVEQGRVTLEGGEQLRASAIVIATDAQHAQALLKGVGVQDSVTVNYRGVRCVYFSAPQSPLREKLLVLNGSLSGIINNLCVPSDISPHYSNTKEALVSVSVLEDSIKNGENLEDRVKSELQIWFGAQVQGWKPAATYSIKQALPDQSPPFLQRPQREVQRNKWLFNCGDYLDNASIEGALVSGRRAAEAVVRQFMSA